MVLGTRGETRRFLREAERAARFGELRRWRKDLVTIGNVRCKTWAPVAEEENDKAEDETMDTEESLGTSSDHVALAKTQRNDSQVSTEPDAETSGAEKSASGTESSKGERIDSSRSIAGLENGAPEPVREGYHPGSTAPKAKTLENNLEDKSPEEIRVPERTEPPLSQPTSKPAEVMRTPEAVFPPSGSSEEQRSAPDWTTS
jgi:hypothetical protein